VTIGNNAEGVGYCSPGLERSDNPGIEHKRTTLTLKRFIAGRTISGLKARLEMMIPGLSLRSKPGLQLANAFGVISTELLPNQICSSKHPQR
jgi:hypothetical protein